MIPSPREILWNQGCCCCLNNSKKRPNFFNGKNGTFEVIETENLHRLWPWFQPRVKPKESEGCLKTDLETKQEYTKVIFYLIFVVIKNRLHRKPMMIILCVGCF